MYQKFLAPLIISIICLTLCACQKMYHPETPPSKRDQCISMKRKQLYMGDDSIHPAEWQPQWQRQTDRELIEREYQKAGCYEVMRDAKKSSEQQNKKSN